MERERTSGRKTGGEWGGLAIKLALIILVFWFCFTILPDILTRMFMDQLNTPTRP